MALQLSYVTLGLLCAVCFLEGADVALWGTSLRAWEVDLKISFASLGVLEMLGGLSMALSGAFWAVFADSRVLTRKDLLVAGCGSWGLLTALVSTVDSVALLFSYRVAVFCMLGCFIPLTQSVIADASSPENRGRYFALLGMSATTGVVACQMLSTGISTTQVYSVQGWRVSFALVGCSSMVIASLFAVFAEIPDTKREFRTFSARVGMERLSNHFGQMLKLLKVRSFGVIVAQGLFGGTAARVMHFNVLWYQYSGATDLQAGYLASLMQAGAFLGNICGGCVGDLLSYWSRWHGRPAMASVTIACAIPIVLLLFGPSCHGDTLSFAHMAPLVFLLGFSISWTVAGCNRPVLAEIAPHKATTMALEYALEVAFASIFGPAIVSVGARTLGYTSSTSQVSEMSSSYRQHNAAALGTTVMVLTAGCYTACASLYCLLHYTYRDDAERAAAAQRGVDKMDEETKMNM